MQEFERKFRILSKSKAALVRNLALPDPPGTALLEHGCLQILRRAHPNLVRLGLNAQFCDNINLRQLMLVLPQLRVVVVRLRSDLSGSFGANANFWRSIGVKESSVDDDKRIKRVSRLRSGGLLLCLRISSDCIHRSRECEACTAARCVHVLYGLRIVVMRALEHFALDKSCPVSPN